MTGLFVLALLQVGAWSSAPAAPTVGDTVILRRAVPAVPGVRARPRPLEASALLEPLDDPRTVRSTGRLEVRYAVALFEPGMHRVPMPPLELVYPDGTVETVTGDTAVVTVVPVLPADSAPPRDSRGPLARRGQRAMPLVLLVTAVLLLSGTWAVLRRRRGPQLPLPVPPDPAEDVPVLGWIGAGEGRAAASWAMERLRARIAAEVPPAARSLGTEECLDVLASERPVWPLRELEDLLRDLDRARFAPLTPSDAGELVDRTGVMLDDLEQWSAADAGAAAAAAEAAAGANGDEAGEGR